MNSWLLPFLSALALATPGDDVHSALRQLDAPSAVERLAAERWLAAHLEASDLAQVADAALTAGPEARRRLAGALGADDRHFELVALLLADSQTGARELGEQALLRLATAWLGEGGTAPVASLRVLASGLVGSEREYRWVQRPGRFEEVVERIVRLSARHSRGEPGVEALSIVVDPSLHGAAFPPGEASGDEPLSVDFEPANLVFHATSVQGAVVEGYGLDGSGSAGPWLHLVPAVPPARRRADVLIATWLRDLLEPRDAARRTAAARALAGTGWGAALGWLDLRWRRDGDASAMEGVLLAASRGRVLPSLLSVERVETLLSEADAALGAGPELGGARARLVMHALAALPPRGVDGEDLSAAVAAGFDGLGARERHLRVAVLAGMGRAPEAWRIGMRARLARRGGGDGAAYLFESVRALAATRDPRVDEVPSALADFPRLLEHAVSRSAGTLFIERLVAARLLPPVDLRSPEAVRAAWGAWERALLAEAWLRVAKDTQRAAEHWRALVAHGTGADEARVGERLYELGPTRARVVLAAVLASANVAALEAGAPPDAATRLCVLAGAWPEGRHAALLANVKIDGAPSPEHLELLGPLAAGPVGDEARSLLMDGVRAALSDETRAGRIDDAWVAPFERAWRELVVAGRDDDAATLTRTLSPRLRRSKHPLRSDLLRGRWPRPAGREPFPLEALEVRLPGS